ncbi:MAG TPA: GNAT family N-acetyltransferase [Actinomycetota bacterium]|nr:GNAT family N-acetyltransferase [Actinomycetota bacterium]
MAIQTSTVTLRPARPEDRDFLLAVYASTRAEEMAIVPWTDEQKDAFVRFQFEAQDRHYREHFARASFDVVLVGGDPAGRLYVDRGPAEIRVVDIAILPEFRGAGVGGMLLGELLNEAERTGRKVSIHVERFNRAIGLYRRMGFTPVADAGGDAYVLMEWVRPSERSTR